MFIFNTLQAISASNYYKSRSKFFSRKIYSETCWISINFFV